MKFARYPRFAVLAMKFARYPRFAVLAMKFARYPRFAVLAMKFARYPRFAVLAMKIAPPCPCSTRFAPTKLARALGIGWPRGKVRAPRGARR
jgi:hypothetical protein